MNAIEVSIWMQSKLDKEGCLYQDDVVDYLVKAGINSLIRENWDGNLVLERKLLNEFRKLNQDQVVWVKPDKYWRFRVPEDELGRDARLLKGTDLFSIAYKKINIPILYRASKTKFYVEQRITSYGLCFS